MKIEESLTKENFWNEIQVEYPNAFKVFSDWIDEYKKEINWSGLFRDHLNGDAKFSSPKFHDLPHAMQLGIWIVFQISLYDTSWEIRFLDFDLRYDITQQMKNLEYNSIKIKNESPDLM